MSNCRATTTAAAVKQQLTTVGHYYKTYPTVSQCCTGRIEAYTCTAITLLDYRHTTSATIFIKTFESERVVEVVVVIVCVCIVECTWSYSFPQCSLPLSLELFLLSLSSQSAHLTNVLTLVLCRQFWDTFSSHHYRKV